MGVRALNRRDMQSNSRDALDPMGAGAGPSPCMRSPSAPPSPPFPLPPSPPAFRAGFDRW